LQVNYLLDLAVLTDTLFLAAVESQCAAFQPGHPMSVAIINTDISETLTWIGRWLVAQNYRFITATPLTHSRILARPEKTSTDLRDVFGWSRAFGQGVLPEQVVNVMDEGGLLERRGGLLWSKIRFSSVDDQLYAHSAYPTADAEAVFFGPDTYRFVNLLKNELAPFPLHEENRILDIGCGAGAGGIAAALAAGGAPPDLVLADINPRALAFAKANAGLAGLDRVELAQGDLFAAVQGEFDFVVANPPYLVDAAARTYRHGGGELGSGLSERIVAEGLPRLSPGGRLSLYTGVAIVNGIDLFFRSIEPLLKAQGWPYRYWELDPDVFGEELETSAYAQAERIAAVALVVRRPRP